MRAVQLAVQQDDRAIVIDHAGAGAGHHAIEDVDPLAFAQQIEVELIEDTLVPVWGHQTSQSLFVHLGNDKDRDWRVCL